MRRRPLTSAERWELGLFLSMLIVGCLLLTALMNLSNLPRLFAWKASGETSQTPAISVPIQPSAPTIEILPQQPAPIAMAASALPPSPQEIAPAKAKLASKPANPDIKIVNGQKYRFVKTLKLRVTAYAPDPRCTYPYPGTTTASGLSVKTNGGKLVAADTSLIPMHALVVVPGYANSNPVPVLDRGGAIKGSRLDVLLPSFSQAQNWGSRNLDVKIYMPVK